MLLMSVRPYSFLPHSVSSDLTMALAGPPPFTTDTNIQFLYVCRNRAATQGKRTGLRQRWKHHRDQQLIVRGHIVIANQPWHAKNANDAQLQQLYEFLQRA
jgi:hypothetical protein